jgi:hypothetical protein
MRKRALALLAGASLTAFAILECLAACDTGSAASPRGPVSATEGDDGGSTAAEDAAANCVTVPLPDGSAVHVTGTVVTSDASTAPGIPIPGAMVAVEYGGLYKEWCDLSKASPYYVFGTVADDAGHFDIDVKEGELGFHSFADGYFYDRAYLQTNTGKTVTLRMTPLKKTQAQPTVRDAGFDKPIIEAGASVVFSAVLATYDDAGDPLSDESLLVEPKESFCVELDPPSRGKKDDFSDGRWTRTITAPSLPGTYTYWFSATTSHCVTTELVRMTLTVK